MAKAKPVIEDVLSRLTRLRPGVPTWFDRLPDDAKQELEQVRKSFTPAIHQKRAFAKAIIEVAAERGWPISGVQGVERWLEKRS